MTTNRPLATTHLPYDPPPPPSSNIFNPSPYASNPLCKSPPNPAFTTPANAPPNTSLLS